jgi:hypothetical protein
MIYFKILYSYFLKLTDGFLQKFQSFLQFANVTF